MRNYLMYFFVNASLLMANPAFSQESATNTKDQGTYVGETRRDFRHGDGTFTWADGATYKGEWRYDLMHGEGKMTFPDGSYYLGEWREGRKHGTGKFYWRNGDVYQGNWIEGEQSGTGKLTYANGNVYDGQWSKGKMNGRGTKTWQNGQRYEGEWLNGEMHGEGFVIRPDGEARVGTWQNGKFMDCLCPKTIYPVEEALANNDAVFLGVVTGIINTEEGYLAKMEILKHWKGEWFTNRSIFLNGGFSSCDFVYADNQTYLVYALKDNSTAYAGVYEAKRCSRTTLIENVYNDLVELDSLVECKGDRVQVPFESGNDPVCGCDGVTYKNAFQAAKAGIQKWEIGECRKEEEESKE